MKKILVTLCLCIFTTAYCTAQQGALHFTGKNTKPGARLTILSEVHAIKRSVAYKTALVQHLYDSSGLRHIILESGRSYAYLMDKYIRTGDTAIWSLLSLSTVKTGFLHELRQMYLQGRKVEVHGIDFERPVFLDVIRYLCEQQNATDNDLYRYATHLPDTINKIRSDDKMWKERKDIYNDCYKLYKADPAYYSAIKDGTFSIKDIFTNPSSETNFARRDAAMSQNFEELYSKITGNMLVIMGAYHIENDGKFYKILLKKTSLQKKDINIISMLNKDCTSGGMYFGHTQRAFSGNKLLLTDTTIANRIFNRYATGDAMHIVALDDDFYKEFPLQKPDNIDHIMVIQCTYNGL